MSDPTTIQWSKKTKDRSNITELTDYVIIKSRTRFSVNLHAVVVWMSRNSLLETGAKSEV